MKKKLLITVMVPSLSAAEAPQGLLEDLLNDARPILGGVGLGEFARGDIDISIVEVKFASAAIIEVQPVMGMLLNYDQWTLFNIGYAKAALRHLKVWTEKVVARLSPIDPSHYGDSSQLLARAA